MNKEKKEKYDRRYKVIKIIFGSISLIIIIFFLIIIIWDPFNVEWGYLGQGYALDYDSRSDIALFKNKEIYNKDGTIKGYEINRTTYVISGGIIDYDYDSTFIVVSHKPLESVPEFFKFNDFYLSMKAYRESKFRQFWIVNKKLDSVWGPFKREEFIEQRKIHGVPDSLKLKKEGL